MNFVNTIIPKSQYKDLDKFGSLTIVHLDPIENGDNIECVETIVDAYDKNTIDAAYAEWKNKIEQDKLNLAKASKLAQIDAYDISSNVNSFSINGTSLWLSRNDRNALMRRFEAEKAAGITNTSLWYGTNKFDLEVNDAITMLNRIEVYACKCYDVTAAHKAAVKDLQILEEVNAYDYTQGYPEKINL